MKDKTKKFLNCKECGASVCEANLAEHMARVHGNEDAKEALAWRDEMELVFSQKMLEAYFSERLGIDKPVFSKQKELKEFLEACGGDFETLGELTFNGIPTDGMSVRASLDKKVRSIPQPEVPEEAEGDAEFIAMLAKLGEMRKDTLEESLREVDAHVTDSDGKGALMRAMFVLFPGFLGSVWKEYFGKRCSPCPMEEFRKRGCEKGEFCCVHDLDFSDARDYVVEGIINRIIAKDDFSMENEASMLADVWKDDAGKRGDYFRSSECALCKEDGGVLCKKCGSTLRPIEKWTKEKDGTEYRRIKCKKCNETLVELKTPLL